MESITIKVDKVLAKEMEKAMKLGYATKTEFIREAIREKIEEKRKKETLELLRKQLGSSKRKTTYAEERRAREQVGKEILKEHALE